MKKSTKSSALKTTFKWSAAGLLTAALVVAGGWEERRELRNLDLADSRLVASILVYQCEEVKGVILIPQHASPVWHATGERIPLDFYRDSVILSKNGVLKLTVPCPVKKEMLARS